MAQLLGTRSHDLFELKGTAGNIVYAFAGDDDFFDSIGNDWMRGGEGNDQFYSAAGGSDLMFGGAGDDEFHLDRGEANIMIRGGGRLQSRDRVQAADRFLWMGEGVMITISEIGANGYWTGSAGLAAIDTLWVWAAAL